MKKIFLLALSLFVIIKLFSQTQGITYQAVIIDKNPQEIPGKDISGNIIPNRAIMVRFTILDAVGAVDYQEEQSTTTDAYGMINLIIGKGTQTANSPLAFTEIDWNGAPKDLKVDISLSQVSVFYTDFSRQELNFIPYAYHKNITATGSLTVDGKSTLQDLSVAATTNLYGTLDVNNASSTHLTGALTVDKVTTMNDPLVVNDQTNLNGQVIIDTYINGNDDKIESYPLIVKGSTQGVAVKIDGNRNNDRNFVTFWDNEGVQGRIEGETKDEVFEDPTWYFTNAGYVIELGIALKDVIAILTSSAPCVGLGVCITTPSTSMTIAAIARAVIRAINIISYNYFRFDHAGVVFKSHGSDYAEYLPKLNSAEKFYPGDIIGVKGGYITHSTEDVDMIMVVSNHPNVLGNMPKEGEEQNFEKVAFIGQVPVKIGGVVNSGDFILPSGNNDGSGIAVSPEKILPNQYYQIVGVAWPNNNSTPYGYTNVAVGLNANDLSKLSIKNDRRISTLERKVDSLQNQIKNMNLVLAQLVPNYASVMGIDTSKINVPSNISLSTSKGENLSSASKEEGEGVTTYYLSGVTDEQIAEGIELAKQIMKEQGVDVENNIFFKNMSTKSDYKVEFVKSFKASVIKELDKAYERDKMAGLNIVKLY